VIDFRRDKHGHEKDRRGYRIFDMENLYNFKCLAIVRHSKTDDIPEKIEIKYFYQIIHDSWNKRSNLYFLFGNPFFNVVSPWINSHEQIYYITSDIISCLEQIGNQIKSNQKQTQAEMYIVYAMYDLYSTIQDYIMSYLRESDELENQVLQNSQGNLEASELSLDDIEILKIRKIYETKIAEENKRHYEETNAIQHDLILEINKIRKNANIDDILKYGKDISIMPYKMDLEINKMILIESKEFLKLILENLNSISNLLDKYDCLLKIIKGINPNNANLWLAKIFADFPVFLDHYQKLLEEKIIETSVEYLKWDRSQVSLTEYFSYIYKGNKTAISENDKIMIPWSIIEQAFNRTGLKNSYTSRGKISKDFEEIKKILKI
jgi:hypothetical protein